MVSVVRYQRLLHILPHSSQLTKGSLCPVIDVLLPYSYIIISNQSPVGLYAGGMLDILHSSLSCDCSRLACMFLRRWLSNFTLPDPALSTVPNLKLELQHQRQRQRQLFRRLIFKASLSYLLTLTPTSTKPTRSRVSYFTTYAISTFLPLFCVKSMLG